MRAMGVALCHLLDDLCIAVDGTYEEACRVRDLVIEKMLWFGFSIAWDKVVLKPSHRVRFQGMVVCTETMRLFAPPEKIEAIEELMEEHVNAGGSQETFRTLASAVGKTLALLPGIPAVRGMLRETQKCIRPVDEEDWDSEAVVSFESLEEFDFVASNLRRFNQWPEGGNPICKRARMTECRIIADASVHGKGYRLDGVVRDLKWSKWSKAVAQEWTSLSDLDQQVYRELMILDEATEDELEVLRGRTCLIQSDCMAAVVYINKGSGASEVLTRIARRIFWRCVMNGIALRAEHFAGVRMIATAVDSFSRASEFAMAWQEFRRIQQDKRWGRRFGELGGSEGCSVDLCASQKTKKCQKYYSRLGEGDGSLGDVRTTSLKKDELYWVVPPIPLIEFVLQRLLEEQVAAIVVVPLWLGKEWSLWIRLRAEEVDVLPWRAYPAMWLDLADKKAKKHEMAASFEFMIAAVDFRRGETIRRVPLEAPLRAKDKRSKGEALLDFVKKQAEWKKEAVLGGRGYGKKAKRQPPRLRWRRKRQSKVWVRPPLHYEVFRVLSLCGGIGTAGLVLKQLFKLFKIQCILEVYEIELCEEARWLAKKLVGQELKSLQPHDLWSWMEDQEEAKKKLRKLGQVHWLEAGFSCQDLSTANKKGKGLLGSKSAVFFVVNWFIKLMQAWYQSEFMAECTWFKNRADEKKEKGIDGGIASKIGGKATRAGGAKLCEDEHGLRGGRRERGTNFEDDVKKSG